jgi:soluble cytochrome b562
MSKNNEINEINEINELTEIIKGFEKMAGDLEGFKKDFKEGFDKVNSRLDAIDEKLGKSNGQVLEQLKRINANLERN